MAEIDTEYYGQYAPALKAAQSVMLAEMERIIGLISTDDEHSPAEHIRSRIKGADSMKAKLAKNGFDTSAATALAKTSDAVGMRVVTHFIGDVYAILDCIRESDCWEVVKVKDYIAAPKPNGYRSLHVIVELPFDGGDICAIRAEIQLRTIAMDCWASLEHQLKYKKNIENTDLIVAELLRCAQEMASTDLTMQTIRDMLRGEE